MVHRLSRFVVLAGGLLAILSPPAAEISRAGQWPQWRGPSGDSVSRETALPVKWNVDRGNVRRTPLPEWGDSTPAIWNDAIFVTTQSGNKLLLLKFDKRTGALRWTRTVGEGTTTRKVPGGGKRTAKFHRLQNLASPSPVTDGERVIVHFGNGDLASYTFDGTREWKRNLADDYGPYTIWWGHANSPTLYGDFVISVCMQDSMEGDWKKLSPSYLVAHNKRTGRVVWKTMRMTGGDAEQCDSYTTPLLVKTEGRTELIVMGGNQLDAYNPRTGSRLWKLPGLVGGRTITGPTVGNGMVFATIGMKGPLNAVRLIGPTERAVARDIDWKQTRSTPDTCCPVVWKGLLFFVSDNGVATCLEARSGRLHWRKRLAGRNYKASPLAADGRIYFLSRSGICTVITAASEFHIQAENRIDDEFLASPAVSDGQLYLRGRKALYTIRKK